MIVRLIAFIACLYVCASCPVSAATASDATLRVDVRRQIGPVPFNYRAGVFLGSLPDGYPKHMLLKEQLPGMLGLVYQFYDFLTSAATEEEFFARLPQSNLTTWVRETAATGGEPYVLLMPVPRWLWSSADGVRRPPRDWGGWERFVYRMVDYYNNQLKIDVRYMVWDEPNVGEAFLGTPNDYLLLYKHAAAGLLRANPRARMGGPAVSEFLGEFEAVKGRRTPPLLPAFVRYCATTPLPGLAPRLPIDMLIWHTFDAAPVSPGQYDFEVRAARTLLRENGYGDKVELNIGSWAVLENFPEVGPNLRDREFLASFIVASVIAMQRAGVDRHAFFNYSEDWQSTPQEFNNSEGLTTRNYIAKAGFNAFRLLGRLQGNEVATQVSDPFVQAAAALENRTLRLIAANFVPPPRMLQQRTLKQMGAEGHTREEFGKALPDREELAQLLKDRQRIETSNLPPDVRSAMLELHDGARLSATRQREPLNLQITVDGMPNGRYRVGVTRVDANSGNNYEIRERFDAQALQRARQAGRDAARDYLAQRWSQPEMAQLKGLLESGNLGALADRVRTMPPQRQKDAKEALALFQDTRFRPVKDFNAATRPQEQFAEVSVNGHTFSWRTTLPPYGVVLVEATRID